MFLGLTGSTRPLPGVQGCLQTPPFPTQLRTGYGSLTLILHHLCCFDYQSWDLLQQLFGNEEHNMAARVDDTVIQGLLELRGWKVILYSLAPSGATTEPQFNLNPPLLVSEQN